MVAQSMAARQYTLLNWYSYSGVSVDFTYYSSPPGQNGGHFADGILRSIFVNEKFWFFIKISLKFVPKGPRDN